MTDIKKYAFNHDGQNMEEALGLQPGDSKRFVKEVQKVWIDADDTVHFFEIAINRVQPKNEVEAMYLGYCLGILAQTRQMQSSFESFKRMLEQ